MTTETRKRREYTNAVGRERVTDAGEGFHCSRRYGIQQCFRITGEYAGLPSGGEVLLLVRVIGYAGVEVLHRLQNLFPGYAGDSDHSAGCRAGTR